LFQIIGFEFPLHITTVGLGNGLQSDILASMAPHGFIYLSDPGQIGACMVNLVAHCKSLANFKNVPLISPQLKIYPYNAVIDPIVLGKTKLGKEYDSFSCELGPILFDIPRHFVLKVRKDEIKKIELTWPRCKHSLIATSTEWKPMFDVEVARSKLVKQIMNFEFAMPVQFKTFQELIKTLPSSSPLFVTMTEQMIPAMTTFYHTWGKHFLKTLPPMLRDERRHSFTDECLQKYNKNINDSDDTLFEQVAQEAELIFAKTPPPKISQTLSPAPQTMPDEFMRGGGCWTGNCKIITKRSEKLEMTNTSDIRKGDYVYNGYTFSRVVCVVKQTLTTEVARHENFMITSYHPIKMNGKWIHPKKVFQFFETIKSEFYDLVLEDTHVVCVENIPCITLAHNVKDDAIASHEYYGTDAILDFLKGQKGFEQGMVILS
jgi:hypothetical protein